MLPRILILSLAVLAIGFSSCRKQACMQVQNYKGFLPVYLSLEELRKPVQSVEPKILEKPGKIVYRDNLLFLNDLYKGIHVISVSNPASPVYLSFIPIPGNTDMSLKDQYLYANSHTDLVVLELSSTGHAVQVARNEGIFPDPYRDFWMNGLTPEQDGVIVGWEEKEVNDTIDCSGRRSNQWFGIGPRPRDGLASTMAAEVMTFDANSSSMSGSGVSGSMARFITYNNHLYTLDENTLRTFSLQNPGVPVLTNEQNAGWGLETLFPYEGNLFMGSMTGMRIFSLSNPASPAFISSFDHATACDPVVVRGSVAYVTLRSGTDCFRAENVLIAVDISNLLQPSEILTRPMHNPHGLTITGNVLLVCEGSAGLVALDATTPQDLAGPAISTTGGFHAYDIIAASNTLAIVTGNTGFLLLDYSNPANIHQVGSIPLP